MKASDRPLVWMHGEVKSPPMSRAARIRAGFLLRRLQRGELLFMPESRPMPSVGEHCHELRLSDGSFSWRLLYHLDPVAVVILDVFPKKTPRTPRVNLEAARRRLRHFLEFARKEHA